VDTELIAATANEAPAAARISRTRDTQNKIGGNRAVGNCIGGSSSADSRGRPNNEQPCNAGLKVRCQLDPNTYPAGIKVSDAELQAVDLIRHDFHGEWNYTISPKVLALEQ